MKTMMTFAAVALCGLTVFVAGCKEETEAEQAQKNLNAAAENAKKAGEKAASDAQKAGDKAAGDAKKALDGLKK